MWRTQVDTAASSPSPQLPVIEKPRTIGARLRGFLAWKKLDRDAAIDSAKNVFAVLGVGSVLADFATMRAWLLVPGAVLLVGIWYADYLRHF